MIGTLGSFAAFFSLLAWVEEVPAAPFSNMVTMIVQLSLTPASSI